MGGNGKNWAKLLKLEQAIQLHKRTNYLQMERIHFFEPPMLDASDLETYSSQAIISTTKE